MAELARMDCPLLGRSFVDFTSSGMTHAWDTALKRLAVWLTVPGHRTLARSLEKNVGEVELDLSAPDAVTATMRVFNHRQQTVIEHELALAQLSLPADAANRTMIAECAAADLGAGVPDSCVQLLQSCRPMLTNFAVVRIAVGHVLVVVLLLLIVGSVVVTPVVLLRRLWRLRHDWLLFSRRFFLYTVFYTMYVTLLNRQMSIT